MDTWLLSLADNIAKGHGPTNQGHAPMATLQQKNVRIYEQTITAASVAAATVAEQTFTVAGLKTTDTVVVNQAAISNATGIAGVRVSAANTLAVRFVNPTAGALTPTAGTWKIMAFSHPTAR